MSISNFLSWAGTFPSSSQPDLSVQFENLKSMFPLVIESSLLYSKDHLIRLILIGSLIYCYVLWPETLHKSYRIHSIDSIDYWFYALKTYIEHNDKFIFPIRIAFIYVFERIKCYFFLLVVCFVVHDIIINNWWFF